MLSGALRCVATVLGACSCVFAVAQSATAATAPTGWRPFAADSVWNHPLRADAPLATSSAAQVAWLRRSVEVNGSWINSTTCGMPMFWADPATPTVAVGLHSSVYQAPAMLRAWAAVPMPPDAAPAACEDKNFAVLQRQPDGTVTQWEFWAAAKAADGSWTARWGGVTNDVEADRGFASDLAWRDPSVEPWLGRSAYYWNVTASSASMTAGVVTVDELRRRRIDHALAFHLNDAAKGRYAWPAQRTDGGSLDPDAIAEGARLRLDPRLDLSRLTMTPLVRMLAEAAQTYGIVMRDKTYSANVFVLEQPRPGEVVPSLLDGQMPDVALRSFPWEALQVIRAPECTSGECVAANEVIVDVDTPAPKVGQPVAFDTTGSTLNQPRAEVAWDFDGDGTYETAVGRQVKATFVPTRSGTHRVAVRVTTRDGSVATGGATVAVAALPVAAPPPLTQRTLRPDGVRATYFYAYSSAWGPIASLTEGTVPPAVPYGSRKLYTSSPSGTAVIDFQDASGTRAGDVAVSAYVECSATRCARLRLLDANGVALAQLDAPYATAGWVTLRLANELSAAELASLRLAVSVRSAANASGSTSLRAVRLTAAVAA